MNEPTILTEPPITTDTAAPTADEISAAKRSPAFQAAIEEVFSERLARERRKIERELRSELQSGSLSTAEPTAPQTTTPADAATTTGIDYDLLAAAIVRAQQAQTAPQTAPQTAANPSQPTPPHGAPLAAVGPVPPPAVAPPAPAANVQHPRSQTLMEYLATPKPVPTQPLGPPASDRGGPSAAYNTFSPADPERWTGDDVARLRAEAVESGRSEPQYVRDAMLRGLRGKTLIFSR